MKKMAEQWIYGLHAVHALLTNPHRSIKRVIISSERHDQRVQEIIQKAETRNVVVETLTAAQLKQRFPDAIHQGVIASASPIPQFSEGDLPQLLKACQSPPLVLVLDGITDPHNLGACLRTADAAGVNFVIIPKDKNVGMTAVVSKVASGAAESVPLVVVTNLVRALEVIKEEGVWIYGAAGEAMQSLYQMDCRGAIALVMGAEDKGLRRLTREHCDALFALPMHGIVDSLNVSVAAGVSLFEAVRQRQGI